MSNTPENYLTSYAAENALAQDFYRNDRRTGLDRLSVQPVSTSVARLSGSTVAECRRVVEAARLGLTLADYDAYVADMERLARAEADRINDVQTESHAFTPRLNRHDD